MLEPSRAGMRCRQGGRGSRIVHASPAASHRESTSATLRATPQSRHEGGQQRASLGPFRQSRFRIQMAARAEQQRRRAARLRPCNAAPGRVVPSSELAIASTGKLAKSPAGTSANARAATGKRGPPESGTATSHAPRTTRVDAARQCANSRHPANDRSPPAASRLAQRLHRAPPSSRAGRAHPMTPATCARRPAAQPPSGSANDPVPSCRSRARSRSSGPSPSP